MIGLGDNIGSGFPTILSAWGSENWRKPDLSENMDIRQVELKLWMVSLMPVECTEYLQTLFGKNYDDLSAEEQIILSTAYLEHEINNNRIQSILNIHSTDVGKHLYNLVQKDMLITNNKGRWTEYRLNHEYKMPAEQLTIDSFADSDIKLNKTDKIIYEYVKENGFITSKQVIEITKINTSAGASIALNRLIDLDIIRKVRSGRGFYYELVNK